MLEPIAVRGAEATGRPFHGKLSCTLSMLEPIAVSGAEATDRPFHGKLSCFSQHTPHTQEE
jgi:hypothetical protein